MCILEDFKLNIPKAKTVTHLLLVFLVITFDILVSIRGVTIRGVIQSGYDQYDFHCLNLKPMMPIVLGVMGSIDPRYDPN